MLLEMDWTHILVLVSVAISIYGSSAYIRDTIKGKSKPNRVSFFLWALAPLIGTGAALSADADIWATVRIFTSGFMPLLILLASFLNPQSFWKLTTFDVLCGVFSVVALIVWGVADSPHMAILFAAIADGFACIPTLVKGWKYPETETGITYIMSFIGALIVIPAIPVWNIENAAFQIYLLTANTALMFVIYRKRLGISFLAKL